MQNAVVIRSRVEMQTQVEQETVYSKRQSVVFRAPKSAEGYAPEIAVKNPKRGRKTSSMRIVEVGDIAEIPTSKGLAYAQCSQVHPMYAHLLRVLPRFYEKRPSNLEIEINQKEAFLVFFPLQTAVNAGIFEIVGRCRVPQHITELPEFRTGLQDRVTKKVKDWWLWDGQQEIRVGPALDSLRGTRIPEVWSAPLLVENIERGWEARDEDWVGPGDDNAA